MCVPTAASVGKVLFDTVSQIAPEVVNFSQAKSTQKYRTQLAINNAKNSQNEALRQRQIGINEARIQKISGINDASKLKAINSSSGFDVNSKTNLYSFQDVIEDSNSKAANIIDNYNLKSDSYFSQANSYLSQAREQQKAYNSSLFASSMNSLGNFTKVAKDWYKDDSAEGGLTNVFI